MRAALLSATLVLLSVASSNAQLPGYCAPGCNSSELGDNRCDFSCMTDSCSMDRQDCGDTRFLPASSWRIIVAFDVDQSRTLNDTEFRAYSSSTTWKSTAVNGSLIPTMPAFTFNRSLFYSYDIKPDGGLDQYELALYLQTFSRQSDMTAPMPSMDWNLWASDTALFLLAIADTDSSGKISRAEAQLTFGVSEDQWALMSTNGWATVDSIAAVLGNTGAAIFGNGMDPTAIPRDISALVVQLFDYDEDGALSFAEMSPFQISRYVFSVFDSMSRDGRLTAKELSSMFEATVGDACDGFTLVYGPEARIHAQIPIVSRPCRWLVLPGWYYNVAVDTNSSLAATARNVFGVSSVIRSDDHASAVNQQVTLLSIKEREMLAQRSQRRLLSIVPSVKSEDDEFALRGVGTPAVANEFPFVVSLLTSAGVRYCGGALVSPNHVVTSASCIDKDGVNTLAGTVRIGGMSSTDATAESRGISLFHRHPSYRIDGRFDVAVLVLSAPSTRRPVELYDGTDVGFTDCKSMSLVALTMLTDLRKKAVMSVSPAECSNTYFWAYDSRQLITPDVMCVTGDISACTGDIDFGGPLVARTPSGRIMLLGVSRMFSMCDSLPVVFTRVSEVLQWILAVGQGMGVRTARKLSISVDSLLLPTGGLLKIYAYASVSMNLAANLTSTCQAGLVTDDFGSGAFVVEYTPAAAEAFMVGCDAACASKYGFTLTVQDLTCTQNFALMPPANQTLAACTDPAMGGLLAPGNAGGIRGCNFTAARGPVPASCTDPKCDMTVQWPQLGPMEVQGRAFAGGLGQRMVKNVTHEFGVWTCLRDWNPEEQLRCGVRPMELGCFWFEEKSRKWSFRGVNSEARLVEPQKFARGLQVEEEMLSNNIVIPQPRGMATSYLV